MTEKIRVQVPAGPRPGPGPVLPQGRSLVTVEAASRHRPHPPGDRRAGRHPAGRRLPADDVRRAGRRRAGPTRASSSRWPWAATPRPTCCAAASRSTRSSPAGTYGGTVDLVVAAHGPGTRWLTALRAHDTVDIVGPLGRPFPLPTEPVGLRAGRRRLRQRAAVLARRGPARARLPRRDGARRGDRGPALRRRRGPARRRRRHRHHRRRLDWAPAAGCPTCCRDVIRRTGAGVVYGCGPMAMLQSITGVAEAEGAVAQVAVEESMACGVGVCMTCVMPVVGNDGLTRMVRSCVEGPVFRGDRVRWDAFERAGAGCPTTPSAHRGPEATDEHRTRRDGDRTPRATRCAEVDMSVALGGRPAAQPADDGLRLRGQRQGAAPLLRRRRARARSSPSR